MRKILISVAIATATLATTTIAATPAAAQRSGGFAPARQIRQDIDQLENRIQRAQQRGTISRREAVSLRREANQLENLFSRYSRNGLNGREISQLRAGINRLQARLRAERRDRNNRNDRRNW